MNLKNRSVINLNKLFNLCFYFLGIFALKGASFILTPLYTKVFTTSEYGSIELANSIVNFLSGVIGLGLCQFIGIEYFHFSNKERTIAIEKNIIMYVFLASPLVLLFGIVTGTGMIHVKGLNNWMFILIALSSYLIYFSNLTLMLCKNQQKIKLMTFAQLLVGVISLLLNYFGVCFFHWSIYSLLITSIVTNFIFVALLPFVYPLNVKYKDVGFDFQEVKKVLRVSFPLAITGLVNSVLIIGDRWILNIFCSTHEIGIYALATKLGSIFELLIINTLTIFYAPSVYMRFQNEGITKTENRNKKFFWIFIPFGVIFLLFFVMTFKYLFPILFDDRFSESIKYLWIVLVGDIFLGATYFRTYLINYEKKTQLILRMNVIAMVFNVLSNLVLIPKYQIYAAAGTTAFSYIIMYIIARIDNARILKKVME